MSDFIFIDDQPQIGCPLSMVNTLDNTVYFGNCNLVTLETLSSYRCSHFSAFVKPFPCVSSNSATNSCFLPEAISVQSDKWISNLQTWSFLHEYEHNTMLSYIVILITALRLGISHILHTWHHTTTTRTKPSFTYIYIQPYRANIPKFFQQLNILPISALLTYNLGTFTYCFVSDNNLL